uniref:LysR family transcriptional regulator n=1 Tax=Ningiella ruwaisensis TaxID=2364274 RepID=UPI00109F0527|nr:LysR family transcriptional regulator [Ningiella ruwaisensis]
MSVSHKNLLAFVSVAQSSTFAEAAEKLYLSQPALSTSIKNLESQLGGLLFARSTRKVSLTPEGQAFLPVAKRLLADWDGAMNDVKDLFSVQKGRLTVAAMPSFAEGPLADILRRYHADYPNIAIRVLDVVMEQVIDAVKANRADLGFIFEPESQQGLRFKALMQDDFCVLMPAGELTKTNHKSMFQLSDLQSKPMVAMNKGSSIRKWVDDAFAKENIAYDLVAEASQLGTLGQLVKSGLGWAIVPQLCNQQMQAKGLICAPLSSPTLSKQVGVIANANTRLSSAALELWDSVSI